MYETSFAHRSVRGMLLVQSGPADKTANRYEHTTARTVMVRCGLAGRGWALRWRFLFAAAFLVLLVLDHLLQQCRLFLQRQL